MVRNRQVAKQHENLEPVMKVFIEKAMVEQDKFFEKTLEETINNAVEKREETMRTVVDDLLGRIRNLESKIDDLNDQVQTKMKISGTKRSRERSVQDKENASSVTTGSRCCICSDNRKCHKHRRQAVKL